MIEITSTRVRKVDTEQNPCLKGLASIVIDGGFIVTGIRILENEHGLYIAMPSMRVTSHGEKKNIEVAHPINAETREIIENAVLNKYKQSIQS